MDFLIALVIVIGLIWLTKSLFWAVVIIAVTCFALWLYRKATKGGRNGY